MENRDTNGKTERARTRKGTVMRRRLMIIATVLAALMVVGSGSWWVWREYYSAEQFRAAMAKGFENGDYKEADKLYTWGADSDKWFKGDMWAQLDNSEAAVVVGNIDIHESSFIVGWSTRIACNRGIVNQHSPIQAAYGHSGGAALLHYATSIGATEHLQSLLAAGANVNAEDGHGDTPLQWAVNSGRLDTAKLLLAGGADVYAEDIHGRTPLHNAAYEGNSDIAKLLLESGANPNAKGNKGKTPLDLAIRKGHTKIADLLKAHMAKQNAPEPAKAP